MAKVEGSIHINVPPEQVMDALLDVAAAPEWTSSLEKVWEVQGRGVGCTYQWQYKMGGMSFEGGTEITEVTPNRLAMKTSGGIPSTWVWTLTSADGGTDLHVTIEYTVPGSVLGAIADKLVIERQNQKDTNQTLANLKTRLEG
jgi:coenzyme Q-binding protein COQ10